MDTIIVGGLTPSDVALSGLGQEELDRLPVPGREIEDIYPLSPMQQGMLFHALHGPEADVYLNQLSVEVDGLELARFERAFAFVMERHAILRTSFVWEGDVPRPLQIVRKSAPLPIEELDWRDRLVGAAELDELAASERARGFDLAQAPLQRVVVVRLAGGRDRLIWTHHHLLTDGWSLAREVEEVFAQYLGEAPGPVAGRYRDYIGWLADRGLEESRKFWTGRLAALDEPTLLSDALKGSRGTTETEAVGAARLRHGESRLEMSAETTERLARFARQERVTLNTLTQGAWLLLLWRYCGQESVAFGATVAGRPADVPGAQEMLGLFINTLPVIQRPLAEQRIGDWLRALQDDNVAMREHEHAPLYEIQRWAGHPGRALFDTILVFENYPVDQALRRRSGAALRFGASSKVETTNYAMTLVVYAGERLRIDFSYLLESFTASQVAALRDHFSCLLEAIAADASRALGDLDIVGPQERREIVEEWSRGSEVAVEGACLHELIEARVKAHPDAIAVVYEERSLSYGELNGRANRLARRLRGLGVGPDVLVGLAVERSLEMVVGLLAILKAGGGYVPLDPDYPLERLGFMIADAGVGLVLTQTHLLETLKRVGGSAREEEGAAETGGFRLLCLDGEDWPEPAADDAVDLASSVYPENIAYCIYTSGSTGQPKGALVSHAAIVNHMEWLRAEIALDPKDYVLQKTSLSFDAAGWEIWLPLLYGSRCCLAKRLTEKVVE